MKPARIETNEETGEVRVTFRPGALEGPAQHVDVTVYSGRSHPGDEELTGDQLAHLERAAEAGSGSLLFELPPVRAGAPGMRKSAAEALAHRGYVRLLHVKEFGRVLTWAAPITKEGRAALAERRGEDSAGTGR